MNHSTILQTRDELHQPRPYATRRHFDLLLVLVARDIKVRYRHSILGFAWSLLNPLLTLAVFVFVFSNFRGINIPNYPLYVFSGLIVYDWSRNGIEQAAASITGNRELVRRPGFANTLLPLVTVLTSLIHFLLALPVLLIFIYTAGLSLQPVVVALPLLIAVQMILTLGLAYPVASLNVYFRDTRYLVGILLTLVFFLTPIFYSAEIIPAEKQFIYRLNPFVRLVEAYRAVLLHGQPPDWSSLIWPLMLGIVLLLTGYALFDRLRHRFIEEL